MGVKQKELEMHETRNESVNFRYYGHCAFLWTTPEGVRVLIDPYRNDPEIDEWIWFHKYFPLVETDLVLVTHPHFDHDAVDCIPGSPTIIRTPGKFQYKDLVVYGILDHHAGRSGQRGMRNVIFVIEAGGLRFCHLGDNRALPPPDVYRDIGKVDILMISVDDSCHLLMTFQEINHLIDSLNPAVVIPMHYFIPEITIPESTLKTAEAWLGTQKVVRRLEQHTLSLSSADVPKTRETWVLIPYQATK